MRKDPRVSTKGPTSSKRGSRRSPKEVLKVRIERRKRIHGPCLTERSRNVRKQKASTSLHEEAALVKGTEKPSKKRARGIDPEAATIEQRIGAPPKPCVTSMEQEAEPREEDQPTQRAPNMEKKHNKPN